MSKLIVQMVSRLINYVDIPQVFDEKLDELKFFNSLRLRNAV